MYSGFVSFSEAFVGRAGPTPLGLTAAAGGVASMVVFASSLTRAVCACRASRRARLSSRHARQVDASCLELLLPHDGQVAHVLPGDVRHSTP